MLWSVESISNHFSYLVGAVLTSLIMIGVGQGGGAQVEWPMPLTAGSFASILITSIT